MLTVSGRAGWDAHGGRASLESLNLTSRRLGGNNMTSYNWENGVSNSGADFCHSSNFGVTYATGAGWPNPAKRSGVLRTGCGIKAFHDQSLALGTFSLLQLPAAGKLPKDIVNLYPPSIAMVSNCGNPPPGFECRCPHAGLIL
jgi:hypothetical protein